MYEFYFDKVLLPVTPEKITMKIGGADKTYTLMNEGEISVLKSPKLTDIEFDLLLPNNQYPFAVYPTSQFVPAVYYLDLIKGYKQEKTPFQFKITRMFPNGTAIFDTDMKVSLESYTIKESADNGFDVVVSVSLKQYRDYGTKTCDVKLDTEKPKASVKKDRPVTNNAPTTAGKEKIVTVKKGDNLWSICKTHLGDGSLYKAVAKENGIPNPNLIYPNQKIKLSANVTSGKPSLPPLKKLGGSRNKPPFAILTSSYGVVKTNIKTWNEATGYYNANGGASKGWTITDSDKDVISI